MVDCLAPAAAAAAAAAAAVAAAAAAAAADEARDAAPRDATSRSTTTWTMRGLIGQWQQWLIVCLLSSWLDDRKGFFRELWAQQQGLHSCCCWGAISTHMSCC